MSLPKTKEKYILPKETEDIKKNQMGSLELKEK